LNDQGALTRGGVHEGVANRGDLVQQLDPVIGRLGLVFVIQKTWAQCVDRLPLYGVRAALNQAGHSISGEHRQRRRIVGVQPRRYSQPSYRQWWAMVRRTIFLVIIQEIVTEVGEVIIQSANWKSAARWIAWIDHVGKQVLLVNHIGCSMHLGSAFPKTCGHEIYAATSRL